VPAHAPQPPVDVVLFNKVPATTFVLPERWILALDDLPRVGRGVLKRAGPVRCGRDKDARLPTSISARFFWI